MTLNFTDAELSHLLSLALQYAVVNRTDAVSRQVNFTAMGKLNNAVGIANAQRNEALRDNMENAGGYGDRDPYLHFCATGETDYSRDGR